MTAGVLLVLFVGWSLWWTDRAGTAEAARSVHALERSFAAAPAAALRPEARPDRGAAFAALRIPRFGADWRRPVLEGAGAPELRRGTGHYPGTALPGAAGNVAIAGHRTTYGKPFRGVDRLRRGDVIELDTAIGRYRYRVTGHRIVDPAEVSVLRATPGRSTLTLTTCHPVYSARERWVVRAELVSAGPRPARPAGEA